MQTKAFKSGNSLAVRIPKDLAIFEPSQDVIIERKGDTLVLRAVERKSLADVMDIFAQFSPDFMKYGRGQASWREQKERDFSGWHQGSTGVDAAQQVTVLHDDRAAYKVTAATTEVSPVKSRVKRKAIVGDKSSHSAKKRTTKK